MPGTLRRLILVAVVLLARLATLSHAQAGREIEGVVQFGGVAVPGAVVTATRETSRVSTTTDASGVYRLRGLSEGTWTITATLVGFAPATFEVVVPPSAPVAPVMLTLLPFADITPRPRPAIAGAVSATTPAPASSALGTPAPRAPAARTPAGGQAPAAAPAGRPAAAVAATPASADDDASSAATDGFLINGSVNNGASSPFAQARAFGNNRPGGRALYNGGFGMLSSHSALDARPFTFSGVRTPKPAYNDVQLLANIGGPLRLPRVRNDPTIYLGGQFIRDHATTVRSGLVPTAAERAGDFSQSRDRLGRAVQLTDPRTGQPLAGNRLSPSQVTPQAAALLGYYPLPNVDGSNGFNYQAPVVTFTQRENVQTRLSQVVSGRDQVVGTVSVTRDTAESTSLFALTDTTRATTADVGVNWSHRLSQSLFLRTRYQGTRLSTQVTPHFANQTNVSGAAGIVGNNQDPTNWGPPSLSFASGVVGLSTANFARNVSWTHGGNAELFRTRGRHAMTFGGGVRDVRLGVVSQQDPRGGFAFTGAASGSDIADFLLGLPQSSSIAFGNADKQLRQWLGEAFVNDDWRVSASLTLNVGVRWEFESPMTEGLGRLVNLDVAPNFAAVQPVLASHAEGALSGATYPASLARPDARGVLPRLGVAWRPVPGSSLVVRGGYGLYRNTNVYQSLALLLAQQPPLSTTATVSATPSAPLTLANGFARAASAPYGTFGVDPDFRVGYVENWQASAQRDLPSSLTVIGTYLGSRGHRLMQQFLPNTYPAGAINPCPSCPAGFAYLTSTGRSLRNAGQFQVRRRLRNGFTATVQYTLAKGTDNAAALSGATLAGSGIAQNWLDLDAEQGRSAFDQRHQVTAQAQFTTGAGITGGTLVDGVRGRLLKDWTMVGQLTVGSGLPVTPVYFAPVSGTGVVGTLRPSLTGVSVADAPDGAYLNPLAYGAPASGTWGDAGRNSVSGPAQFGFNAAVSRTFRWGNRLYLDWRIDATNVLNVVTYASVNSVVGSLQFGLPTNANQMRRLQSSLRARF